MIANIQSHVIPKSNYDVSQMPQMFFCLKSITFKFLKDWFYDQIKSLYKVASPWNSL